MLKQLKALLTQKKKELSQNSHLCVTTDFEEVEQDAKGLELHKIITELTELIDSLPENTLELEIKDFDGVLLKKDSIIQLLDEDGEPYDRKTSPIRIVCSEDKYTVRAFENNLSYVSLSDDTYARYFRIVEVV